MTANHAPSAAPTPPHSQSWNGIDWLAALRVAARWLEQHTDAINALNVFPVPDGDTGTNMVLTLSGALEGIEPDPSCAVVADRVRYGAIMRGRGNSGIILSQVLRGMAQALAGHDRLGPQELGDALARASATAYKAVMTPVEGTMLTVVREAAEAAQAAAARQASLAGTLEAAAQAAHDSVQRTPQLLKTLRDAGVVDAGGHGFALLLDGILRYARGESPDRGALPRQAIAFIDQHGPDEFGYCTTFVIQGSAMPFEEIRTALGRMGQSVAVVGDELLIKVHLHLLRPGDALNYALQFGTLAQIEITNMDLQRQALADQRSTGHAGHGEAPAIEGAGEPPPAVRTPHPMSYNTLATAVGVVAITPGDGFAAIFQSLGAGVVVDGGPTTNPSTAELLDAIERLPQPDVIVLPNNANGILAARQAAQLSAKRVAVVPSTTVPQGIAAFTALNFRADLDANLPAMTAALRQVRTAEITRASRDATIEGIVARAGQVVGLLDGALVIAADSRDTVIDSLLDRIQLAPCELISIYYGERITADDAQALAGRIQDRFPDVDIEVRHGGQAIYEYIISAE